MNNIKTSLSQTYPPGLYIVATPIGNLRDITLLALDVLQMVDVILCEDTRTSKKLLAHYDIRTKLLSYHDHNGEERRPQILSMLAEGKTLALISDAGTPLISDPGYKLVRAVYEEGYYISVLPGASSVLAALCLAGLPTDNFYFAGFLPVKDKARGDKLAILSRIDSTIIIFESAKRLVDSCSALLVAFGDREVAVIREITKLHEESRRGKLSEHIEYYRKNSTPRGEVVIVVSPPSEIAAKLDPKKIIIKLLANHSLKDAAAIAAEQAGISRKEAYAIALSCK